MIMMLMGMMMVMLMLMMVYLGAGVLLDVTNMVKPALLGRGATPV